MTKKIKKFFVNKKVFFVLAFFLFFIVHKSVFAQTTTTFPPPITPRTAEELITAIINNLQGVMMVLAMLFIVIGGIIYITSSGNENRIKRAKAIITYACIGLAVALAGPSFLKQIQEILGVDSDPGVITLSDIITNILKFLLSILGIIAITVLVVAGGMYLTSGGMEERMKTAKKTATYAIIGITIALSSLIVVQQIVKLLEID
jgi:hypothetical protein